MWSIVRVNVPQREDYQANIVHYEDLICLKHNKTGCTLSLNKFHKSPKSGNAESIKIFVIFQKVINLYLLY